jgi:hypothetical protein
LQLVKLAEEVWHAARPRLALALLLLSS